MRGDPRVSTGLVRLAVGLATLVGGSAVIATGRGDGQPRTTCPIYICGQNSPDVDKSPIHGLNVDGMERDGVRLVPASLTGGRCPGAASLDVIDGGFVGVAEGEPGPLCTGDELVGATFAIEQGGERRTIAIAARTSMPTWEREPERLPAYELRWADGDPVCTSGDPRAILVGGELYDPRDATVVPVPAAERGRWFNVACATSGLAKMRLLGLDPTITDQAAPRWSAPEERQAALKMVTARYCGSRAYTRDGTELRWARGGEPSARPQGAAVEAVWGPEGATCLSQPRAADERAHADAIRAACGLPACEASPAVGDGQWISHVLARP